MKTAGQVFTGFVLSAEQSAKSTQAKKRLMAVRDEFRQQRKADRQQFLDLIAADSIDQQQALAMINKKTQFIDANAPQIVATLVEFSDSLDASQKQKLVEMLDWKLGGGQHHYH